MKVSVEIITGTFIATEVSENATVKELKEKIAAEVKLSVKRLILVIGDHEEERRMVKEDDDEMMLIDLGVREDSRVYLFFKHPDLVSNEERSQGRGDDASVEEFSLEADSRRENDEEENVKIDGEEEDKAMKNEEEDGDEKVEDEDEEKEKNGGEANDDDVENGKEEAREGEEGDDKA